MLLLPYLGIALAILRGFLLNFAKEPVVGRRLGGFPRRPVAGPPGRFYSKSLRPGFPQWVPPVAGPRGSPGLPSGSPSLRSRVPPAPDLEPEILSQRS